MIKGRSQGSNTQRHARSNALMLSRLALGWQVVRLVVRQPVCGKSMKPLKTLSASEPL